VGIISVNPLGLFVFTVLSVGIVLIFRFLDCVLDYKKTEYVEFEDEESCYQVRIIPKIALPQTENTRGRVRGATPGHGAFNEPD
jgi:hypothetical protein